MKNYSMEKIEKIFSNQLRVDIVIYLHTKGELTLSQITKLMNKSKSAMSRQMKQLVELDMIEEIERDLKNPGSPHKAYRISNTFMEHFVHICEKDTFFDILDKRTYLTYILGMIAVSKRINSLTQSYLEDIDQKNTEDNQVDMGVLFFTEDQKKEVKHLLQKFILDVQKLPKNQKSNPVELLFISTLPYEKMRKD